MYYDPGEYIDENLERHKTYFVNVFQDFNRAKEAYWAKFEARTLTEDDEKAWKTARTRYYDAIGRREPA